MARQTQSLAPLADLTVVVPVGPGDRVSPVLLAQLGKLPRSAELHPVFANADDAAQLAALPVSGGGPIQCTLIAAPGRASQQNTGAAAATREWLWFLHADSELSPVAFASLAGFVQRSDAALGYFDLRFLDDGPPLMRLNELGAGLRTRWLGLPFGDQGLVLQRSLFERLGGFDPRLDRGEDHELVWRARRAGIPPCPVGAPLYTSARRYAESGWFATTFGNLRDTWRQARRFSHTSALQ